MAGYIPEEKITEIKNSIDIVELISEGIFLKKAGRNHLGLCPFHSEKTPSFTVSPDKQIFYCFGCGTGGNVFTFLMKQEGLSFIEAVKSLARRAGIELPEQNPTPEMKKRLDEREQLYGINKAAAGYFFKCLGSDVGKNARDYLKRRGIFQETIDIFKLGYAPRGWDNIGQFFKKKGSSVALVEKAGLVVPRSSKNGHYDRFRDRIIFPIFNVGKQVIGFGGRVMDDSVPKYLNSPETPIFNKSRSLYGLNFSRPHCRKSGNVFMVEGYFDMISLYQSGIRDVVATLGTSLTLEHVRMLKGVSPKVTLVFDSDEAGLKAARRSIRLFIQESMEAAVMVLPKGYDPDSFVNEFGESEFRKAADRASGIVGFLVDSAIEKHGLSVEGKLKIVADMKEPIGAIRDAVARSLYIKELAEKIEADEQVLQRGFDRSGPDEAVPVKKEAFSVGRSEPDDGVNRLTFKAESKIVAMMLQCPEMVPEIEQSNALDYFENEALKSIGEAVIRHMNSENTDPTAILGNLGDEKQRNLAARLSMGDRDSWHEEGCRKQIFQFVSAAGGRKKKNLIEQIKTAEKNKDMELLNKLLSKKHRLAVDHQERQMALLKQIV